MGKTPRPWDARTAGRQKPKIDLRLPGFGAAVGRPDDRFRCSGGTWDEDVYAERVTLVRKLGARALDPSEAWLGEILVAVLEQRLSLADVHVASRRGDAGLQQLLSTRKAPPLAPLLDRYLREKRKKNPTKVRRAIARFLDATGGADRVTTAVLTRERISDYLAAYGRLNASHGGRIGEPVKPATINRTLGAIAAFCSWLVATEVLVRNPCASIADLDEGLHRVPGFTAGEYAKYVAQLERDWRDDPRILVLLTLLHSGADLGEVIRMDKPYPSVGLRVQQIEFADPRAAGALTRIRFRRSKTKTPERQVPIPPWLAERLRAHIARYALQPGDILFPTVTRSKVASAHGRARQAISRPELRVKDLRHVAAIFWRKGGADLFTLQQWLGHSDPKQTQIYADFLPEDAFDAPFVLKASQLLTGEQDIPNLSDRRKGAAGA